MIGEVADHFLFLTGNLRIFGGCLLNPPIHPWLPCTGDPCSSASLPLLQHLSGTNLDGQLLVLFCSTLGRILIFHSDLCNNLFFRQSRPCSPGWSGVAIYAGLSLIKLSAIFPAAVFSVHPHSSLLFSPPSSESCLLS